MSRRQSMRADEPEMKCEICGKHTYVLTRRKKHWVCQHCYRKMSKPSRREEE